MDTDLTIINAGGFLLHLLPGAEESVIDKVEENIKDLPPVTEMLTSGMSPDDMANRILKDLEPDFLDSTEVSYRCTCSRKRMEKVLISLGREELMRLAEEQEETEIVCHFCNSAYKFSREEMLALAESSSQKTEDKEETEVN